MHMLQEFNKSSIISRYIKNLINSTPLPVYKLVYDNEYIEAGCLYQYRDRLIRCTASGVFTGIRGVEGNFDYLYASDDITVTERSIEKWDDAHKRVVTAPFVVTDGKVKWSPKVANFETIRRINIGNYVPGMTQQINITSSSYDSKTHLYLGEYLRWLKNISGVNLMPLYNCFSGTEITGYHLDKNSSLVEGNSPLTRLYIVPIKFNREYTVALQSNFEVRMTPVFFNKVPIVNHKDTSQYLHEVIKMQRDDGSYYMDRSYSGMNFNNPVMFSVNSYQFPVGGKLSFREALVYEKYLYLALQVPVSSDSSIVVIEGNFTTNSTRVISDIFITETGAASSARLDEQLVSSLSLLKNNNGKIQPFSDKLIQYLLCNTIDTREKITDNIARIQEKIGYIPPHLGSWDDKLRFMLYNRYMDIAEQRGLEIDDVLGYVDDDVENAINRGYIKFGYK